jgi:glycosyltransferase involved in cell wall biosynthesis
MLSILVTGFNRPDLLEKCLNSILNQSFPCEIFVHLDGPRDLKETELTQECKNIISRLELSNSVKIMSESHNLNLGCKESMWCALDWFFSHSTKGLILEDDVMVLPGALKAAALLLDKFEFETSICQISLSNQIAHRKGSKVSYFLSNYPFIWGWATWKDRWDTNIKDISKVFGEFTESKQATIIKRQIGKRAFRYWLKKFESAYTIGIDTWDFQWHFTNWYYHRKSLHFNKIFAINVGFDHRATHTKVATRRDIKNLKQLRVQRNGNLQFHLKRFSLISLTDRRISSRVFGIPHWFFHPLKFFKNYLNSISS